MSTATTIYATKGTMLDGDNVAVNYGSATTWNIGQQCTGFGCGTPSERSNAVLSFDVSAYTDPSAITVAVLNLTTAGAEHKGSAERQIYAYRLDQDFTEAEATWQEADDGGDWTGGTTVGAANNSAITQYSKSARRKLYGSCPVGFRVTDEPDIDITELVKDAINRRSGTLLLWVGIPLSDSATTSGFVIVHSPDAATSTNRPKIDITVADRIVWDGSAGDGVATTASNWVGDAAPDYYDYAVFNDGAVDVTSGNIQANSCFIGEGYTGTIEEDDGDPIGFLVLSTTGHPVQNKLLINKKSGRFNIKATAASAEVDVFVENTPREIGSEIVTGVADKTTVTVNKSGSPLTLSGDTAFKDIILSADSTGSRNIIIEVVASPLKASKSKVIIESALGEFILSNGTKATATTASTAIATSGTSWIVGNSMMNHRGKDTGADINIADGRLTFKNNENGRIETEGIILWNGGVFDPRTWVGAWGSVADPNIEIKGGGNFIVDVGRTLTIAN